MALIKMKSIVHFVRSVGHTYKSYFQKQGVVNLFLRAAYSRIQMPTAKRFVFNRDFFIIAGHARPPSRERWSDVSLGVAQQKRAPLGARFSYFAFLFFMMVSTIPYFFASSADM